MLWIPLDNGDFESMVLWIGGEVKGVPKVGWAAIPGEGLGWL